MFQLQDGDKVAYHENMTVDRTMELIDALKKGSVPGKNSRDASKDVK
jgi:hypothetical protein